MDNHPIPQDVTHFQFKLIGEMTIKQFGYIAGGAILAWITFSLPILFLIKLVFAGFFGFLGIFLALIPVEGRPADLMLSYFLKALFKPDQYIFQKIDNYSPRVAPSTSRPPTTISSRTIPYQTPSSFSTQLPKQSIPPSSVAPTNMVPSSFVQPITPSFPIAKPASAPRVQQPPTVQKIISQPVPSPPQHVNQLENQLQTTLAEKEALEKQLLDLKQQLQGQKQQKASSVSTSPANIRKIPTPSLLPKSVPFVPDFPNLIVGVVKDARGNVLPNILIEVKDKEGNPVRAFKTNPLGQFASATPLLNGMYTILFEDPGGKHRFDAFEIIASGEVMQPIEVISIDEREELRRELFIKPVQ